MKQISRLSRYVVAKNEAISEPLAKALADYASESGRMVAVLVDRSGKVGEIVIGEKRRLYLPDIGRARGGALRLRGLRLLVAKPTFKRAAKGKYELDADFVTDLEKLRLDCVLQLEVLQDGHIGQASVAHLSASPDPADRHEKLCFSNFYLMEFPFDEVIGEIEHAFSSARTKKGKVTKSRGKRELAVLVGVYTHTNKRWKASLEELKALSDTASVHVADTVIQRRERLDPKTVVGKGKLEDICLHALHLGAEMLIFDCDLTPSQLNAITDLTDLKVLDRTMLILDIFANRAQSRASKLQVELAQLNYAQPRLEKKQTGLSRLTGGIGGQGPGETKLEVDKRRVREKIARLEKDITRMADQRRLLRKNRVVNNVPTVAIVGYTNAGKSTLLNRMTQSEVYVKNQLFATLDPTSRRLRFSQTKELVLIDTVGFIHNLPPHLVRAFKSTLEELSEADLLLIVLDGSDKEVQTHMTVVQGILEDLEVDNKEQLCVINKVDQVGEEDLQSLKERYSAIPVSAKTGNGLRELSDHLVHTLWPQESIIDNID